MTLSTQKHLLANLNRSLNLKFFLGKRTAPSNFPHHAEKLCRYQVESSYATQTWQREAYDSFVATLIAKSPVFPCIYATKGFKANEQRFLFLNSDHLSSPSNTSAVASALINYLTQSRQLGPNTSLVILCRSSQSPRSVKDYHDDYWRFLKSLRSLDAKPWPAEFPEETNSDTWCFCFNGIPTFTVVQTPAHEHRHSRYAPNLRVIIQPKWIFDVLFSTPQKRTGALKVVRELMRDYDDIPISPDLKNYGEEGSRESRQYFLLDENVSALCPYETLTA